MSAKDAFDDIVEEMTEGIEEQPESQEPEAAEPVEEVAEPKKPAKAAKSAKAEPEPEAEEPAEPEQAAEPDAAAEVDAAAALEAERERNERLLAEMKRIRAKARLSEVQASERQAPNPTGSTRTPVPQPDQHGEVDDGLIWESGRARVDPEFIRRQIEAATRPDPRAEVARREDELRRSFVGLDEGSRDRAASYSRADEAMDFFNLKMWDISQQTGADLSRLGVEGILATARDVGVLAEIEEHYPDVAPHVTDFLIAGTLPPGHGDLAMRSALSRYHDSRVSYQRAPQAAQSARSAPLQNTARATVRSDRPPSTVGVGAPPTGDNASSKNQREQALTDKLAADPFDGLNAAEEKELRALRADLGL